jgi:hypothetical protein
MIGTWLIGFFIFLYFWSKKRKEDIASSVPLLINGEELIYSSDIK